MTLNLNDSSYAGRQPEGAGKWFARRRAFRAFRKMAYKVYQLPSGIYRVADTAERDAAFINEERDGLYFRVTSDAAAVEIAYKFGVDVFHNNK